MKLGHIDGHISWERKGLRSPAAHWTIPKVPQVSPVGQSWMNPHFQLDRALFCTEILQISCPFLLLSCPVCAHFNRLTREPLFSVFPLVLSSLEIKK